MGAMAQWANKEKILARFAALPPAMTDAVAAQLRQEVQDLVDAEKRAAPVSDLGLHPGQLREEIQAYPNPNRPFSWRVIAGARDAAGRLFSRFVEFGHTAAGGQFVPATPFWFPTYRARKKAMRRRIFAAARKVLKALFPGDTSGLN